MYWYSLISARPNPEADENINVALLFGNGAPSHIEYGEGLARLGCLVGAFEVSLYRHVLQSVAKDITRFSSVAELRQVIGPQLRISDPRPLNERPSHRITRFLIDEYLPEPQKAGHHRKRHPRVAKLDHTIRDVLSHRAAAVEISKRPTPKDLYPSVALELFSVPVPPVDRALRSGARDLLIGGVSLSPRDPSSVRDPGVRLGRAFWHYKEAKPALERRAHVQIRTLGIIYNGAAASDAAHDAVEYIQHIWQHDADSVVRMDELGGVEQLRREVDWLTQTRG
jgi:hypothetical protein